MVMHSTDILLLFSILYAMFVSALKMNIVNIFVTNDSLVEDGYEALQNALTEAFWEYSR